MRSRGQAFAAARPWRDLALFLGGPALLAVVIAAAFAVHPWPIPYAVQAGGYQPLFLGPLLALAALGVWLSSRIGPPSAPSLRDGRAWARLLAVSALVGLAFAALSGVLDLTLHLERIGAAAIGQRSINVPFPWSLAHYTYGTVLEECVAHLIPIPILCWLLGVLLLRGRRPLAVFWVVLALVSVLEPVAQALQIAHVAPVAALAVFLMEYPGNLVLGGLFLRFGWPALVVARLGIELGWHVAWPLLSGG